MQRAGAGRCEERGPGGRWWKKKHFVAATTFAGGGIMCETWVKVLRYRQALPERNVRVASMGDYAVAIARRAGELYLWEELRDEHDHFLIESDGEGRYLVDQQVV